MKEKREGPPEPGDQRDQFLMGGPKNRSWGEGEAWRGDTTLKKKSKGIAQKTCGKAVGE